MVNVTALSKCVCILTVACCEGFAGWSVRNNKHCDWELAAWGMMRDSISAHRAPKAKAQTHHSER